MRPTVALLIITVPALAADPSPITDFLRRPLLPADEVTLEIRDHVRPKVARLHPPDSDKSAVKSAADWENEANRLRREVLDKAIFRGEAAKWRDAKTRVEYLDTIKMDGYRIKKLRYEILPDFWIPALLYESEKLVEGKVPVSLAVNGHEPVGKAADYKQIRCINMVKRGMVVLNVEWLGMGQLRTPGNRHGVMNQLELCGSSGLAPFYLSMSRGLDILLAHPNADPKRVVVSGLSGGGWQTIVISSLDTRVTLANPVAGYSSFLTRMEHHKDLGDSEQTPTDLGMVADYTHLTALMAPRPTLLTYNAKDNCCFESGYALEPLRGAAAPYFKLFDREAALKTHVNEVPGDHNFGIDNRQALYRMFGEFFYRGDASYLAEEIPCEKDVKTAEQLHVAPHPASLDMNSLSKALAKGLPRDAEWPARAAEAADWQAAKRKQLAEVLRIEPGMKVDPRFSPRHEPRHAEKDGVKATFWMLKLAERWTVPVVELTKGEPKGTTLVIADGGRASTSAHVERLLAAGQRVLAADLLDFGEAHPNSRAYLWSLLIATVGDRPLGIQANQLLSVARWADGDKKGPVSVLAVGPRSGVIALAAAALETKPIERVELQSPLGSLKVVIEENRSVEQSPELFCFGLLEHFDFKHLAALVAPRKVTIRSASERARAEFAGLGDWYRLLGTPHNPLE